MQEELDVESAVNILFNFVVWIGAASRNTQISQLDKPEQEWNALRLIRVSSCISRIVFA